MKKNVSKFLGILLCSVSVFSNGLVYGGKPWDIDEDFKLLNNVSEIMSRKKWDYISSLFNGSRTPDECLERYNNHLVPALGKVWKREEIDTLHRKVLAKGYCWKEFEEYFNIPAIIIMNKYYETLERYRALMKTMDEDCTWLPKQLWVADVDLSD